MVADRMSLAVPIMALRFQTFFGDDDNTFKKPVNFDVIAE